MSHGRPAEPDSLAEVNRAIAARERIELVRSPDGVSVGHSHVGDPLDDALARLADPLVHEIGAGRADRVRICANDTCRWVFYDESRGGPPAMVRHGDRAATGRRPPATGHGPRPSTTSQEAPAADAQPSAN